MKITVSLTFLVLSVVVSRADWTGWLEGKFDDLSQPDLPQADLPQVDLPQPDLPQPDLPQADLPQADQDDDDEDDDGGRGVERLINAVKDAFQEMTKRRSSWYERYDALAAGAANKSAVITELLAISSVAMPIIWNAFVGAHLTERQGKLRQENIRTFSPSDQLESQRLSVPVGFTEQDDFTVEITMALNKIDSVGVMLMPETEEDIVRYEGDILVAADLHWHYLNDDRVLVFSDMTAGTLGPREEKYRDDTWRNIALGERFLMLFMKRGSCIHVFISSGKSMYLQEPKPVAPYTFCPQERRQSKMLRDPSPLSVVVETIDAEPGTVEVYSVVWW